MEMKPLLGTSSTFFDVEQNPRRKPIFLGYSDNFVVVWYQQGLQH